MQLWISSLVCSYADKEHCCLPLSSTLFLYKITLIFFQVDTILCIQLYVSGDVDSNPDSVVDLNDPRTIPFLLSMNGSIKQWNFRASLQGNFWRNCLPSKEFASRLELNFSFLYDIMSRYHDWNSCLMKDEVSTRDLRAEKLKEPGH